jgi:hypothetical protein
MIKHYIYFFFNSEIMIYINNDIYKNNRGKKEWGKVQEPTQVKKAQIELRPTQTPPIHCIIYA